MSFRRHLTSLIMYSLSPVQYNFRVSVTSEYSVGSKFLVFSNVNETRATLPALLLLDPLKMTSPMVSRRSSRLLCSPSTQRMASTTLLFPDPFGPTIPTISSSKSIWVSSAKLLKPFISILDKRMDAKYCQFMILSGRHFNMMWKTRLLIKVILEVYDINNIYNNPIYDFNGPRSFHTNTHAFDAYDQHNHIHSDGDQLYRQR